MRPEDVTVLTETLAQTLRQFQKPERLAMGLATTSQGDVTDTSAGTPAATDQNSDRDLAMEMLQAITALGYRIEKTVPTPVSASVCPAPSGTAEANASRIAELLETVARAETSPQELLQVFHSEAYLPWWHQDVRLYRAFGRALITAGHPTHAFELVREGLLQHPADATLEYLRALALRRGGNLTKALEYVEILIQRPGLEPALQEEALSLVGALHKVQYSWTTRRSRQRRVAQEAAAAYERAYQISGNGFPGINAATMALLAGKWTQARDLATQVITRTLADLQHPERSQDYWLYAILGEAHLILGDLAATVTWYRRAVQQAAGRLGDLAAMRGNLRLLQQAVPVSAELLELFPLGSVVVFSGHMIDHPSREEPRFPPDAALEARVYEDITTILDDLKVTVGYGSAACGADLLFAEGLLARGAELHIVLPFAREDFYATSVARGLPAAAAWRQRCDAVLARATEVHYATTEPFLGDSVLFEFGNTVAQGLALSRAEQLGVEPWAVVVLDPATPPIVGGTDDFISRWSTRGHRTRVINLATLRAEVQPALTPPAPASMPPPPVPSGKIKRHLKAMLFADVKNFSKLSEAQSPLFFVRFQDEVARILRTAQVQPAFCNTWGDGLYLVFHHVVECAEFAIRLLDRVAAIHWESLELPADTTVRIGLHAGPVYPQRDRLIGRQNFFGSHVNRAARIEPVTTPGCAFASEQFAAALAVESGHAFVCEYVGVEALAKGYDLCPLYRLRRRE
jgi:class 3 adenylate cyclase